MRGAVVLHIGQIVTLDAYDMSSRDESHSEGARLTRLSDRERQVLTLVVEGKSSKQIARLLHLSPKSVETYRSRIMTKLGIEGLPALVKFAIRNGLTTVE